MKTIVVKECGDFTSSDTFVLDISNTNIKDCSGCWTCWWKTPGKCIFKDLNEFYHEYVTADKVIFFARVSKGFVTGNLKTLFDRMIPLFMPYTSISSGESMHVTRYDKYPDIEFYYEDNFETKDSKKVYEEYIHRVFYQFHSKNIVVKPMSQYIVKGNI